MRNEEIRRVAKESGVKLWQIGQEIGVNDGNFSRKLRQEFSQEEKERVLKIIERLSKEERN